MHSKLRTAAHPAPAADVWGPSPWRQGGGPQRGGTGWDRSAYPAQVGRPHPLRPGSPPRGPKPAARVQTLPTRKLDSGSSRRPSSRCGSSSPRSPPPRRANSGRAPCWSSGHHARFPSLALVFARSRLTQARTDHLDRAPFLYFPFRAVRWITVAPCFRSALPEPDLSHFTGS
jgi:hypothetical protein